MVWSVLWRRLRGFPCDALPSERTSAERATRALDAKIAAELADRAPRPSRLRRHRPGKRQRKSGDPGEDRR